jgi:hypothetical protein
MKSPVPEMQKTSHKAGFFKYGAGLGIDLFIHYIDFY